MDEQDGFPLKFNAQNILKTSRFTLKIVTSACKVFDAGYYTEDAGLNINEVGHSRSSCTECSTG